MKIEGLRVVRGPDWKWGDQDGGEGSVGTVVGLKKEMRVKGALSELLGLGRHLGSLSDLFSDRLSPSDENNNRAGLVKVVWDCGIQADYRAGFQGCYDLLIVDDAAGGVKHQNTPCHDCGVKEIVGMRWECAECKSNFCSSCFYQIENRHVHFNAFSRYISGDLNSEPLTVFVNKPGIKKLHLRGIFPGAKVERGKHWSYGDEDGKQMGDVMPTAGSTLIEGRVDVKWRFDGITVTYRRGNQGKMELKAVEAASGGRYHPEWLRVLKVITEEESKDSSTSIKHFSVGDRVKIVATVSEMREKQSGHGGWIESMKKAVGEAGTVLKVDGNGDIHVKFEKLNQMWCLNPTVVEKLTTFSIGQIVRVRDDIDTMRAMRIQLGSDGNKVIFAMAGEAGRVTEVGIEVDGGERVHLELMKESSFKPLPAMKSEWLEAVPVAFKLHEYYSKLKTKLGNLFVEAAQEADLYLLRDLLDNHKVSVDVDHKSTPSLTALHLACRRGNLQVVEWLLEQKANIEKTDDKGRPALYHAVKGGEEEVLRLLIKKGAELNTKTKKRGLTALQKAIAKRQTKCAEILIDNGCDVNHQDQDGDTPLHNAVYRLKDAMVLDGDAPSVFDALINSGRANINIRNKKGLSVFHVAVGVGNLRIVKYFLSLENAAEFVLEKIPKKELSALHIACMKGYFEIAKILLDYVEKLDKDSMKEGIWASFMNEKDKDDQTPLMMASMGNYYSLIELLVDAGTDINLKDKDGDTAISLIMMKVGKDQSRSPIPSSDSTVIHEIYKAIYNTPIFAETMAKHPSLSAACYLISKGGDPDAGGALSKTSDTTIDNILRSFIPDEPDNSRTAVVDQGTSCLICGRSTTPVLYDCCNEKSSIFCSNCSLQIKICPCCRKIILRQRPPSKNASNSLELSSSIDTFINISSPYSMELEDHDDLIDSPVKVSSPQLSKSSKCPSQATVPNGNVIKQSKSISTGPDVEMMDASSESSPPLNPFSTPSGSKQSLPNEQSGWTLKIKGSRKNTDLLLDVHGNTFTKRSPNIWQCTKKSDSQKNKCPALVKEKTLSDGTIKYEILKAEHKHAESAANSRLYGQAL